MKPTCAGPNPPRWAETLLRFLLRPRDRDPVSGDLLEEYREVILPARGRLRAHLWYLRQVLSLVGTVKSGLAIGTVFGAWNLAYTFFAPLAEDTVPAVASFYLPMFALWGAIGFAASCQTGKMLDAIKAGMIVGAVTMAVFQASAFLRVNLFLEPLTQRSGWQNLLAHFRRSNFENLRAYVNYSYATQIAPKLVAGVLIGAVSGAVGGAISRLGPPRGSGLTSGSRQIV